MKANHQFILVENPGTGNVSVANALRLVPETGRAFLTPREIRSQFPEKWDGRKKIVIVRDPVLRFECLATAAYATLSPKTVPDKFYELLARTRDLSRKEKGKALLGYLLDGGPRPKYLNDQSDWLCSKFDIVLTTPMIATWFNREVRRPCVRTNAFRSNPALRKHHVAADEALVRELYAKDYDLLGSLRVWSPSDEEVYLYTGVCIPCKKKLEAKEAAKTYGDEPEPVNGLSVGQIEASVESPASEVPEPSDEKPKLADPYEEPQPFKFDGSKKVRARRRRKG